MGYDKPFLDYPDLLKALQNHNIEIDVDKQQAIKMLESLSYYDLVNGYKNPLADEDENFVAVNSLRKLFTFARFDREVQSTLVHYSFFVENRFKNILSYHISKDFGVHFKDYLNSRKYKNQGTLIKKGKKHDILAKFQNTLTNAKDNPTAYYRENHNNIPPWILFKNSSFSDCINLLEVLSSPTKNNVLSDLIPSNKLKVNNSKRAQTIINALNTVRRFRNVIAHNLNFINFKISTNQTFSVSDFQTYLSPLIETKDLTNRGNGDAFSFILSIIMLLDYPSNIVYFLLNLNNRFSLADYDLMVDYLKALNLPLDFHKRISTFLVNKHWAALQNGVLISLEN